MASKPTFNKQADIVDFVQSTFDAYKEATSNWRKDLLDVYREYITFSQPKKAEWETTFKVNKAHEVVNKILPRIMSKDPKRIVSAKTDALKEGDEFARGKERDDNKTNINEMAEVVQDYLHYIFDQYGISEPIRLWAKNMIIYGNSYAKVIYKYESARIRGEDGNISEKVI